MKTITITAAITATYPRPIDGPLEMRSFLARILSARPGTIRVSDLEHSLTKHGFMLHVPALRLSVMVGLLPHPETGTLGIEAWGFDSERGICVRRERTEGPAAQRAYAQIAQALRPHAEYCRAHPNEPAIVPASEQEQTGRRRHRGGKKHRAGRRHRGGGSGNRGRNGAVRA